MPISARWFAAAVLILGLTPISCPAQTEQPTRSAEAAKLLKSDPLHVFSESVQQLSSQVTKSVVQVLTTGFGLSSEDDKTETAYLEPERGIGAGVLLSPDGLIVTNAHVIQGARKIRVRKQGQIVFAFGSPLGLENSVSMGVISATARQIDPDKPEIYIQTDAPINPGNSGGPLVDVDGRVVGINTFILSQSGGNEGLGFAIPSDVVRSVFDQIRTEGHVHRGQIGVFLRTINPDLVEGLHLPVNHGVLLEDVIPGSAAEKAGLKVGDVVVSVGGKPINDVRHFALDLYTYKVGQKADVGVLRNGQVQTVAVTVMERPDDPQRFADMLTGPDNLIGRLGVVALALNPELREALGDVRIPSGVLVAARTQTSTLLGEGPQPGDIIHAVNGAPVQDLTNLKQALRKIKSGDAIVLQIERSGELRYLVLESE